MERNQDVGGLFYKIPLSNINPKHLSLRHDYDAGFTRVMRGDLPSRDVCDRCAVTRVGLGQAFSFPKSDCTGDQSTSHTDLGERGESQKDFF